MTTASRMFLSGIDEQLIMERTRHRSTGSVRAFKLTSDVQRKQLSDILNCTQPELVLSDTMPEDCRCDTESSISMPEEKKPKLEPPPSPLADQENVVPV